MEPLIAIVYTAVAVLFAGTGVFAVVQFRRMARDRRRREFR